MVYYNSEKPKSGLSAWEQLIGELEVSQELSKEEMTYRAALPGKCVHQSSTENRIARSTLPSPCCKFPLSPCSLELSRPMSCLKGAQASFHSVESFYEVQELPSGLKSVFHML